MRSRRLRQRQSCPFDEGSRLLECLLTRHLYLSKRGNKLLSDTPQRPITNYYGARQLRKPFGIASIAPIEMIIRFAVDESQHESFWLPVGLRESFEHSRSLSEQCRVY